MYYFLRKGGLSGKEIMKNYDVDNFNEQMRLRTKIFATSLFHYFAIYVLFPQYRPL